MEKRVTQAQKQSLIAGGLTSSAGIFLTKALGIFYMSPFQQIVGEANTVYYGKAYNLYDYVLTISLAGIPMAIAALVSKYLAREDYKSVLLIRKLSTAVLAFFGCIMASLVILCSPWISRLVMSSQISPEDLKKMQNVFVIISLAVFAVPLLSSYRGFIQGFKEFKAYAFSQVLEQVARIAFLLGMGAFVVYVLDMDRIWGVYVAVGSTSFSAVVAIIHMVFFAGKRAREVKDLANSQTVGSPERRELLKELFMFALPYLAVTFLGTATTMTNFALFEKAMDNRHLETIEEIKLLDSMLSLTANKITSIPQVLAPGFSAAIIPFVTVAFEQKDRTKIQQLAREAVETVLYIGLPLVFFLVLIPQELYYVLFGKSSSWQLGGEVTRWCALLGFFGMISPVFNNLMLALRQRKTSLMILAAGFILNFVITIPFITLFGYSGAVTSSSTASLFIITIDLYIMRKRFGITFHETLGRIAKMSLGIGAMALALQACRMLISITTISSRLVSLAVLAGYGLVGMLVYLGVTQLLGLPQQILHTGIWRLFKRLIKR
ncbi:MAG: oligosaccharide flippase family protein [Erysipelotrichaceae bacterium]|jgi:O-antigen/teichoic acid export membrane protein|nr:oligosaccharide flippase family protein [Erysipelotrichaceae bacterium]